VEATSAKSLLELAGSWDDGRDAEEIINELRAGRRNARRTPVL
jgi:hypothetical protein